MLEIAIIFQSNVLLVACTSSESYHIDGKMCPWDQLLPYIYAVLISDGPLSVFWASCI
jgi:hypothetical protein